MKNLNYKLIISDFDGTLVKDDGTVSEENKRAISDYIASGGIFAIATGRLPFAILPHARSLGLKGLICCCQGTMILDIESGEIIFEDRLSLDNTLSACLKMEQMGLHIQAFDLWEYYSNKDDYLLELYEKVTGNKGIRVTDKKLSEFICEKGQGMYKLIAMVEPADNAPVLAELSAANLEGCTVTKSMDYLVEVINNKYSKGSAISYLAKHYGIEMEKTVAVGDNYNDIPMIEAAGLGIAVANAENALKEQSEYVCCCSNEESAIAEIIEKFGYCK